jgi:DMSO reductase family type II enzyme chaperone
MLNHNAITGARSSMLNNDPAVNELMKGECFRFLAACFYQPNKEVIGSENFFPNLQQNLQQGCPAAAPAAKRMQESLSAYTEDELVVEYARLFVGPFGLKAPPYGSVYLDNDRTVMGPSTMETIRFYEEEGLVRDEEFHELPDHIAVELEFMYYLSYRRTEALQKGDSAGAEAYQLKQEQFRTRFLEKWAPLFCKQIKEETDNGFYSALADCMTTFVQGTSNTMTIRTGS